jgi:glycosyltransferase involved in cell wall biosynthesis
MFSIISICKGRLSHLKQTLPAMLYQFNKQMQFRTDYEVIVVDYGCPDNSFSHVTKVACSRKDLSIKSIRVKDKTEKWNPGRCRNIGANQATGDWLFFIDADMILQPNVLLNVEKIIQDKNPVCIHKNIYSGVGDKNGTCLIHAKEFHEINGYNEKGIGWCYEDVDIYNRLDHYNRTVLYDENIIRITPIRHGWDLRSRFNDIKDIKQNIDTYYPSMCKEQEYVNPKGYGQGKLQIFTNQHTK